MSMRLWAYEPEKCDGNICPNECDRCPKAKEPKDEDEVEQDGYLTWDICFYGE